MELCRRLTRPLAAISGGLGDIGRSIGLHLAGLGADIALGDQAEEKLAMELIQEIESKGRDAFYAPLDVSDSASVRRWYCAVFERFRRVPNILVSNAAIVTQRKFAELSSLEWEREIAVNLNGSYHFASQGILPLSRSGKPGRVVFIGSWAAHAPHTGLPAYSVTKAGLRMLVKTMALEFAGQGILVNEVAPGYVAAGLTEKVFRKDAELRKRMESAVPSQHLISVEEVSRQVAFLCSEDANHLVGATVLMDGGLSLLQGPSW